MPCVNLCQRSAPPATLVIDQPRGHHLPRWREAVSCHAGGRGSKRDGPRWHRLPQALPFCFARGPVPEDQAAACALHLRRHPATCARLPPLCLIIPVGIRCRAASWREAVSGPAAGSCGKQRELASQCAENPLKPVFSKFVALLLHFRAIFEPLTNKKTHDCNRFLYGSSWVFTWCDGRDSNPRPTDS